LTNIINYRKVYNYVFLKAVHLAKFAKRTSLILALSKGEGEGNKKPPKEALECV
jgi:hypothetical protein